MENEKTFVGGYKIHEYENKNMDIDGFLSNTISKAVYPASNLIHKIKDKQNISALENYGVPAGLVVSIPKIVSYNEFSGGNREDNKKQKKGGTTENIPQVIPENLFDELFGLISSNTKPKGGFYNNSKTQKQKQKE